jgi:hypothetical protein
MREDGALKRKLVVYREVTDRLTAGHDLPVDSLHQAAHIVHEYIEGFHEGLEEVCVPCPAARRAAYRFFVDTLLVRHSYGGALSMTADLCREAVAQLKDLIRGAAGALRYRGGSGASRLCVFGHRVSSR